MNNQPKNYIKHQVYVRFKENICAKDLDVIDVFTKYPWVKPLKDKMFLMLLSKQ